ncbi:MAG: alpha/beta hydrolase-fold protein [Gammaproteobacteria bacterium]|nr:alpha/beta hydrolase-fold protein [Gammaproteobacteria bacterium]MDE0364009.1 alpha/beta hydrolase-fold protein [Gammaproteobacteria bacterium]
MKRREFVSSAAALAAASTLSGSAGSSGGAEVSSLNAPWPLRGSESFAVRSETVGDSLAVGVWQPEAQMLELTGRTTSGPLDLVYVLDGSWALAMAATICRLQLVDLVKPGFPPLLLAGVDYLEDKPNARTRDYTHTDLATPLQAGELPPEQTIGGADKFLRFLEEELDPMIRSRYQVTDRPAGILGDSYGGTFTFHAFRRQSKLFDRYFLGSPGLFDTEVDYIGAVKTLLEGKLVHETKMYLSFGALEANGGVSFYEEMGRNYNGLVSVLNTTPNDRLEFASKMYPGHTHTTILAPAFNDALLYLYGPHLPLA